MFRRQRCRRDRAAAWQTAWRMSARACSCCRALPCLDHACLRGEAGVEGNSEARVETACATWDGEFMPGTHRLACLVRPPPPDAALARGVARRRRPLSRLALGD